MPILARSTYNQKDFGSFDQAITTNTEKVLEEKILEIKIQTSCLLTRKSDFRNTK